MTHTDTAPTAGSGPRGGHHIQRAAAVGLAATLGLLTAAAAFLAPAAAQAATTAVSPGEGTGPGWCTTYGAAGAKALYSYDNVWACGPNATNGPTPFDSDGTQSFQCVELSERFLWAIDGLAPIFGSNVDGTDLVSLYHSAHPSIAAGSPGPSSLPQPGDVMSFSPGGDVGSAGHTAVVVSAPNSAGNFTIMSENWADTAGEQTVHIDMSGAHNGEVQLPNSSYWNTASFLELKGAPPPQTSQLVFDDYTPGGSIYSIQVDGINQDGQVQDACFTTPRTVDLISGWWWAEGTQIWAYTSNNCTTGELHSWPFTLTDTATAPPYHCQEDVSPYADWNPGTNWENCAITPSPNGVWYGDATGSFVKNM